MNPTVASNDLKQLRTAVGQQRYTIMGLSGAVVMCLILMGMLVGRERTILVPPVIEKTFWVSHDKVSSSYLEQMAAFVAYLILDVSPTSVEWKKNLLLQYVDVNNVGELEMRQKTEADRLQAANAAMQYSVQSLTADERDMAVIMTGRLSTYINGQRTNDEQKYYLLQFAYASGRVSLKKFEEVSSDEARIKQQSMHK